MRINSTCAFIAAIYLIFCLSGCASRDFQVAIERDDAKSYRSFLSKHPEGKYSQRAKERLDELAYVNAVMKNQNTSYQNFLQDNTNSRFADDVRSRYGVFAAYQSNSYNEYMFAGVGYGIGVVHLSVENETTDILSLNIVGQEMFSGELSPGQIINVQARGGSLIVAYEKSRPYHSKSFFFDAESGERSLRLTIDIDQSVNVDSGDLPVYIFNHYCPVNN